MYIQNDVLTALVIAYVVSGCCVAASKILSNFERMILDILIKKNYNIPGYEKADLVQEGNVAILQKLPQFNPQRGSLSTFVHYVVDSHFKKLIQLHNYDKRKTLDTALSLDETNEEKESIWSNSLVATDNVESEIVEKLYNRQITSECFFHCSSNSDKEILKGIMEGDSDQKIADRLGECRVTITNRRNALLRKLRRKICNEGA